LALSPRLRYKFDRIREQLSGIFGGPREAPRPKLCPSCSTLVGASATKCHQCGASMNFGMAAASRSLSRLLPTTSPATYGILSLSCLLYGASLLATVRTSGFQAPGGGFFGIFNFGAIDVRVLIKLGASMRWPADFEYPWRLVMPTFLHGSLMHIGFNMWVLMDIGPQIEELYGSARYFFIYVAAGIGGYILSGLLGGHVSIGGSASLLGLIGLLLAVTTKRSGASMQMLRSQLIKWLIYIAIMGIVMSGIDNFAHLGGLISGFLIGKVMADHPPMSQQERTRADLLGWTTAIIVIASIGVVAYGLFQAS
jgi:membrane associated rhomboid family serine protease